MPSRSLMLATLLLGLTGCSGPQVRTLGTGDALPAYELRGSSLAELRAEAARLCGQGYVVLRQAQRYAPPQPEDNPATLWLQQVGNWLEGMPDNQAQATVQCRA